MLDIKARSVKLKLKNIDVIRELKEKGVKCNQGEYSNAINGSLTTPKSQLIISIADEILTEYEKGQHHGNTNTASN